MYKRALLTSPLVLTVLLASAGCDSGQSTVFAAPEYGLLIPQQKIKAAFEPTGALDTPVKELAGPRVQLTARFFMARSELLTKHLGVTDMSNFTVSNQQASEAIEACKKDSSGHMLASPRLKLFSGQEQEAQIIVGREQAFVSDIVYTPGTGKGLNAFDAEVDSICSGVILSVKVKIEDNSTVITDLQAKATEILAFRRCSAKVQRDDKAGWTGWKFWQEVIFLERRGAVTEADPASIAAGQCLVIPMAAQVRQTTGNARAYAVNGKIRETIEYYPRTGRPSAAEMQLVLLITARPAADEQVTAKASLPAHRPNLR